MGPTLLHVAVESRDDRWMGVSWTRADPTVTMRFRIHGIPAGVGHVIGQKTWYDVTRWGWTTEARKSGTRNHANLNPTGRTSGTSRIGVRTMPGFNDQNVGGFHYT